MCEGADVRGHAPPQAALRLPLPVAGSVSAWSSVGLGPLAAAPAPCPALHRHGLICLFNHSWSTDMQDLCLPMGRVTLKMIPGQCRDRDVLRLL